VNSLLYCSRNERRLTWTYEEKNVFSNVIVPLNSKLLCTCNKNKDIVEATRKKWRAE